MSFVKKSISAWITAAIVLVVGILCIVGGVKYCNNESGSEEVIKAISLTLGIALIVVGGLGVVIATVGSLFDKKGFAAGVGLAGVVLALGIWIVATESAWTLIVLLISLVPYLLVVIGGVMFIDTSFKLYAAIKEKKVAKALASVIVGYILASAAIVFGALCLAGVINGGVQLIIFGILVCVYACFMVLATFVNIPTAVVIIKEKPAEEKK